MEILRKHKRGLLSFRYFAKTSLFYSSKELLCLYGHSLGAPGYLKSRFLLHSDFGSRAQFPHQRCNAC